MTVILTNPDTREGHFNKLAREGARVLALWDGNPPLSLSQRKAELRGLGYTKAEITEGLKVIRTFPRKKPLSSSQLRANTNTKEANAAWERMKANYQNCCSYCGVFSDKLTKDHVVPISRGGADNMGNIVPACFDCNHTNITH